MTTALKPTFTVSATDAAVPSDLVRSDALLELLEAQVAGDGPTPVLVSVRRLEEGRLEVTLPARPFGGVPVVDLFLTRGEQLRTRARAFAELLENPEQSHRWIAARRDVGLELLGMLLEVFPAAPTNAGGAVAGYLCGVADALLRGSNGRDELRTVRRLLLTLPDLLDGGAEDYREEVLDVCERLLEAEEALEGWDTGLGEVLEIAREVVSSAKGRPGERLEGLHGVIRHRRTVAQIERLVAELERILGNLGGAS